VVASASSFAARKRKAPSEMERMMEQEIAKRRATESSSGAPVAVAASARGSAARASRWGEAPAPGDAADAAAAKKQEKKEKKKKKKKKKETERGAGADAAADDAPPWLLPNIVVRVVNQTLGKGAFYKQKGRVVSVADEYCATVAMLTGEAAGKSVRIDQDELETVIPSTEAGGALFISFVCFSCFIFFCLLIYPLLCTRSFRRRKRAAVLSSPSSVECTGESSQRFSRAIGSGTAPRCASSRAGLSSRSTTRMCVNARREAAYEPVSAEYSTAGSLVVEHR
jgi:hypothetical protein